MAGRAKATSQERQAAFLVLYQAGWSDYAIARVICTTQRAVRLWRLDRALEPNNPRRPKRIEDDIAIELFQKGLSDRQVAEHFGCGQDSVTRWRNRRGIAPSFPRHEVYSKEDRRRVTKEILLGSTAKQAAETIGAHKSTILAWRKKMRGTGLRGTGVSNRIIASQIRKDAAILERIEKAIGFGTPDDVRSEATMSLYTAVLEGRIATQFIEQEAGRFRSEAWKLCGSYYGPRSLDEQTEDGWSLMDALDDPDALEGLEAAGEAAYDIRFD